MSALFSIIPTPEKKFRNENCDARVRCGIKLPLPNGITVIDSSQVKFRAFEKRLLTPSLPGTRREHSRSYGLTMGRYKEFREPKRRGYDDDYAPQDLLAEKSRGLPKLSAPAQAPPSSEPV